MWLPVATCPSAGQLMQTSGNLSSYALTPAFHEEFLDEFRSLARQCDSRYRVLQFFWLDRARLGRASI